jgi:hypothetical protein
MQQMPPRLSSSGLFTYTGRNDSTETGVRIAATGVGGGVSLYGSSGSGAAQSGSAGVVLALELN